MLTGGDAVGECEVHAGIAVEKQTLFCPLQCVCVCVCVCACVCICACERECVRECVCVRGESERVCLFMWRFEQRTERGNVYEQREEMFEQREVVVRRERV